MKEPCLGKQKFSLLVKIEKSNGCPIPQYGLQTSTSDNFHTKITIISNDYHYWLKLRNLTDVRLLNTNYRHQHLIKFDQIILKGMNSRTY